jgi:hypothetical protein
MTPRHFLLSLIPALVLVAEAAAQPRIVPPPPPVYAVQLRYRIRVGGNERVLQYREMMRRLAAAGFTRTDVPDPNEPADPDADRISGTIASGRVAELLAEPHVKTILLMPAGYTLPDDPEQRVLVQIKLTEGLSPNRQHDLFFQSLDKLRRMGLIEKVGYDHEDFTRILGTIPAVDVDTLLGDLRLQPAGWLTPEMPIEGLPEPIRDVNPIRGAEVLVEPEGVPPGADVPPPPLPPPGQEFLAKIAPDLRAVAADQPGPVRIEVVLTRAPSLDDTTWRDLFSAKSGIFVEGRIGPVVTVLAPAAAIRTLAAMNEVATVRPPRSATRQPVFTPPGLAPAVAATGLDRLHGLGFRGKGTRVAVIDADFAGLAKHFPKTPVVDLTAARNASLLSDPTPAVELSRGTRLALAVRLAAPDAEIIPIRVDPAAMYQMLTVARFIHGDAFRPDSLVARNRELLGDNDLLRVERTKLTAERREMLSEFNQDEEYVQKRKALEERTAALARQEQDYNDRLARYYVLESALADLRRVNVVVSPLAWDEGYPFDGSGPLSRYLDDRYYGWPRTDFVGPIAVPRPTALWFQATGNTRGQAWNGPLIDADANGAFEFAPSGLRLPPGQWTTEVNFLAWQLAGVGRTFDLPAGAKIRLTFQWTEAHDPAVSDIPGPDLYRAPLADLHLLVLRQRDPSGTKVASDDFNVVARTEPLPQLIERHGSWATYEHVLEFAVDAPGRFAVRLAGYVPPTTRPATVPTIPALERAWEARGRLFVTAAGLNTGHVVIADYQPGLGELGAPGNAKLPRTVGAANAEGRRQPYSSGGPPAGQLLLTKPTFLVFDELPLPGVPAGAGTEQSAAFAAGMMASMLSAGTIESQQLKWLDIPPGGMLRVPPVWMDQLERRWPKTGRE